MEIKELLKKYSVFILGLYFLAVGIVLIVRFTLGTTPISSVNYVLSLNTPFSLGTWTFIVNILLIMGQFWLIRKDRSRQDTIEILLQIPFSFIFSAFIDFNMILTSNLQPSSYGMAMGLLLVGCLVQSIGVVLEIKPKVAMMSAEAFVKYASRCYSGTNFAHVYTRDRRHTRRLTYCSLHYRVYRQFPESEDYDEKDTLQVIIRFKIKK